MEPIKNTIKAVFESLSSRKSESPEANLESFLKKVLTKKEFGHIKVNRFKQDVLYVKVDSSTWMYHFGLKKEKILSGLRQGAKKIKDIHFYIGEIK